MAGDEVLFLDDDLVEKLLKLTEAPEGYDSTGYVGDQGVLYACSAFRHPYTSQGVTVAFPRELLLEIDEASEAEVAEETKPDASTATPYAPRNYAQVPIFKALPVVVLDFTVPQGYRLWLNAYAFNLFPNTANELNYVWQLNVNGGDILSKSSNTLLPGRPVQTPGQVTIGRDKTTMALIQPGNRVQVVVSAVANLGASDFVSAALFGFLEGVDQ